MEKIKEFFAKFGSGGKGGIGQLSATQKIVAIAAVALIIIGVIVAFAMKRGDDYEYLFVNISPEDSQAIASYMKKAGMTDYVIDDKGVKVLPENVMSLRLKLAQEGLPSNGLVGWEKFDNQDFTRTEFEQKIMRLRAIQGELARTIMSLDGINSARVHIVLPNNSLFVEDQKDPTASIFIKTRRGQELDSRQIKGIVHLSSKAVEGLKPENISIIDHEGKLLTKVESQDVGARMTREMHEYRKTLEKDLEEKVRIIVARVVGPERVESKVDVEVDFTQEEQTISDLDPDKVIAISKNTQGQKISGAGLNPTGVPGAKSNVPGEGQEVNPATSSSQGSRDSELINFDVAKTLSKRTLPIGNIKRISAAVLVDGKQVYPTDGSNPVFEARTEEEMKKISDLVKSAIGFKDGRDEVKVHNMMFQLDPYQVQEISEKKKENREYISTLAVSAVIAMALVFFFAFIVRPYFRWLSYDPERKKQESIIEEFKPDLELGGIQNVQVKEDVPFDKLTPQEQILYLAKHEPKRTTEAIRMLLNPHANVAAH